MKLKNVFKLFESNANLTSNSIFSIDSLDKVTFDDNECFRYPSLYILLLFLLLFNTVSSLILLLLLLANSDSEEDSDKFDVDDDVDDF